MGIILYNLFLLLYRAGVRIAAIGSSKARAWTAGRKKWPEVKTTGKTIWMHCSSLGEFEQGRPLLEQIRKSHPSHRIILTFFSPSGYEIRKNYQGADAVLYLPMDSKRNAARFIEMIKPELVLWVKYDFWYYYLTALKSRNIPVLLISAVFREDQIFFRGYGALWRMMLECFNMVFVQNKSSEETLRTQLSHIPVSCSGDTRFDRVTEIAGSGKEIEYIRDFCNGRKVLVAGSTWEDDEEEMMHYSKNHPEIVFIIAPHLVDDGNIREVKKRFPGAICYSQLPVPEKPAAKNVLIIDNIGMLSRLYHYADITYVGGGFGNDGIHNILEAAVYGKPVIIGPVYEKFFEAVELIACGGGFSIQNALQFEELLNALFNDEEKIKRAGEASFEYVKNNTGATSRIMRHIQEKRLLTS